VTKQAKRTKLEYFPWHAAKYAADTTHLSEPADAAYRRIMDHIFMHDQVTCRVALDDDLLIGISRRTPEEWLRVRRSLIDGPAPMFAKEDDSNGGAWIYSPFLRSVIKEAKTKTRQARDASNERWKRERSADAMRAHSQRNESKKKKVKRQKKQPTEPSVPSVAERETTPTSARERAIEARSAEVARWLREHPAAEQCFGCTPHAPHAPRQCGEQLRDQSLCTCDADTGTRLAPKAAAEFMSRFQETWDSWCARRDAVARDAA
jgi:uncharacterized protein YdaU (DUF1376 family)